MTVGANGPHGGAWADTRVLARLVELYGEGKSCSQIARTLNLEYPSASLTRNAVIGKISRLGMSRARPAKPGVVRTFRPEPRRAPKAVARHHRPADVRAATLSGKALPPVHAAPARPEDIAVAPRPWITRGPGECAAIVAGQGADAVSCCNPTYGTPYCQAHRARFWTKPLPAAEKAVGWALRRFA